MLNRLSPAEKILFSILVPALLVVIVAFGNSWVVAGRLAFTPDIALFIKTMLALVAISTLGLLIARMWEYVQERRKIERFQR